MFLSSYNYRIFVKAWKNLKKLWKYMSVVSAKLNTCIYSVKLQNVKITETLLDFELERFKNSLISVQLGFQCLNSYKSVMRQSQCWQEI